jgi:hypothetical protein
MPQINVSIDNVRANESRATRHQYLHCVALILQSSIAARSTQHAARIARRHEGNIASVRTDYAGSSATTADRSRTFHNPNVMVSDVAA